MAGGSFSALLPLMEVDSRLTGRRGIALPFTDNCETFFNGQDSGRRLWESALEFGKARNWKYLECRGGREFFDDVPPSLSFYGHELGLNESEDQLFARCAESVRRAVRKAEKSGVTVAVSQSRDAIKKFFALQCKTRKKHGLPPQPLRFFEKIHEHVLAQNLGVVIVASHEKKPIAASVYFQMGCRAIYKYGASDESFQHLRGGNLVMWEAIKWHRQRGFQSLHLGRTSLRNEGLRRFKLGWGAAENRIEYFKYNLRQKQFVSDTDGAAGWYNRIFKILPPPASRLIGALLYRHWA